MSVWVDSLNGRVAFELLRNLSIGSEFVTKADSTSMIPAIYPGDLVRVRRKMVDGTQIGDIIAFYSFRRKVLVAHRVIGFNKSKDSRKAFVTGGDANRMPDAEPVTPSNFLGTVVGVRRGQQKSVSARIRRILKYLIKD